MKIIHALGLIKIEKALREDKGVLFLLGNQKGGYLSLAENPLSKYQGWFFRNEKKFKLFKVIEDLKIGGRVDELRNNYWNVERKRDGLTEKFFLPSFLNSLVYELNIAAPVEVELDIRESYGSPQFGRFYEISCEGEVIVIKYTHEGDVIYLAIKPDVLAFTKLARWEPRTYSLDQKRFSFPGEFHIFKAVRLSAKKIVFSVSTSRREAVKEARYVFQESKNLQAKEKKATNEFLTENAMRTKDHEVNFAFLGAIQSLRNLLVFNDQSNLQGMYAGLPWFFQFWARDFFLSSGALDVILPEENKKLVLETLFGHLLSGVDSVEGVPFKPSADSWGWAWKRLGDLIQRGALDEKEINRVKIFLEESISHLLRHETVNGFAVHDPAGTWMDTSRRSAVSIEAQALRLGKYRLAYALTKDKGYFYLERGLKERVRRHFWSGQVLADGFNDFTIRPNIFLAAYAYPELLRQEEWRQCFGAAMGKLWLDWGGVASLDKINEMFRREHDGELGQSYHNGDSWFYLNNLAALVLTDIGGPRFSHFVKRILKASAEEILWRGAVGHHAEVSSACVLSSEGCWAQAWSNAFFIEAIGNLAAAEQLVKRKK